MHVPTDIKILNEIYNMYYSEFIDFKKGQRPAKIYVSIDCELIGKKLNVDRDIIFGRLYYHLNDKYGYKQSNGNDVYFLIPELKGHKNCVNFPLLSSVLANLREDNRKFKITINISILALILSVFASVISIVGS